MSSLDGRGEGGGKGRYRETEEGKCCHRVGVGDAAALVYSWRPTVEDLFLVYQVFLGYTGLGMGSTDVPPKTSSQEI